MQTGFASLRESPRDLWLIFILKILEAYQYFSMSRILTLYLSEEFNIDDIKAGSIFGVWGSILTLYGLILGGAIDFLGIKRSLLLCFSINFCSRIVMACTTSSWMFLGMLLGPNALAGALGVPVMTIAVKRFTTTHNRGFAFSLFYTLMNIAALAMGLLLDVFRISFKDGFNIAILHRSHVFNSGTRLFVLSGCVTSFAGLILTAFLREPMVSLFTVETSDVDEEEELYAPLTSEHKRKESIIHRREEFWSSLKVIFMSPGFKKFLCMCLLTLRAFGCDVPIGAIYAINPAMIIVLVPIVGAVTSRFAPFDAIHYGGWISALSPLWIVAVPSLWPTAAFVATLSLGEAVWSPRWYDYAMSVAPDGREGLFVALTSAPLFLAMLPTGVISGALLQRYCPGEGSCTADEAATCDGRSLWAVIAAIAISSPLLITLTQRWIRPAEGDFAALERVHHIHVAVPMSPPEVNVNEADPAALLEHVSQAMD